MGSSSPEQSDTQNPVHFAENDWYVGTFAYKGYAKACFEAPTGCLEGPVSLTISDTGVFTAKLEIESMVSPEPLPLGVMQLLNRDRITSEDGTVSMSITEDTTSNPCIVFFARFAEGIFQSTDAYVTSHNESWTRGSSSSESITFRFFGGFFIPHDASLDKLPRYWVLPLTNLLARFPTGVSGFASHPLRLRQQLDPPADLSDDEKSIFAFNSHNAHPLIPFSFSGRPGYIEPLTSYASLKESLQRGLLSNAVTALMIAEIPDGVNTLEEIDKLLPRDITILLGAATGNSIGSPWIELRDAYGGLCSRFFSSRGTPTFSRGHVAITNLGSSNLGALVTAAAGSAQFNSSMFRFVGSSVGRSGLHSMTVEERLSIIFRALDSISKSLSIGKQISAETLLDDDSKLLLVTYLKSAAAQIRKIERDLPSDSPSHIKKALNKVAQNIDNAKFVNAGFGNTLRGLFLEFGFHDLVVVDQFMKEHRLAGRAKWEDFVAYCRGIVMHDGYIDGERHPDLDLYAPVLLDHLEDVLLRIFLKMCNYDGGYQPTTLRMLGDYAVDWVQPDTLPERLGYDDPAHR